MRRDGVTVAISTGGGAPALAGLLREALDAILPDELDRWFDVARAARADWRALVVPIAERRPLLLRALLSGATSTEPARPRAAGGAVVTAPGLVSLVGAGPGDPELLTLRALRRLRDADLVLNDALVPPALLELAPGARRFFVGKRAGRHSIEQATIHRPDDPRAAPRRARRAAQVRRPVRPRPRRRGGARPRRRRRALRGRPRPELGDRRARPLAGIPVTHRGLASGFVAVSGHAERGLRAGPRRPRARRGRPSSC